MESSKATPEEQPIEQQERPLSTIIQDLFNGFQRLSRSEIRLIRAEFEAASEKAVRHLLITTAFILLTALSLLPFLAFLVIGLGKLLNSNYWLSSLIVCIVFVTIGVPCGILFARKLKKEDLSFILTRTHLQKEAEIVRNKMHEITELVQRRAS